MTSCPRYVACIALLRLMGKRTLSKMNAFDLVVTVALGSTLAAAFVDDQITLTQSVLALTVLIALQFVVSRSMVRFPLVNRWRAPIRPCFCMRVG